MRTYEKILILLFAATVAFSTFIFLPSRDSDNDEALRSFRSLFSKQSVRRLPATVRSIQDETSNTSLYYGGISVIAIIMIGVALRMARGGDSKPSRKSPAEPKPHVQAVKLPSREERSERKTNEVARQDLEAKARRIYALEGELNEKDKLLKIGEEELEALRSQVRALTERQDEMMSVSRQQESTLRKELDKTTNLLEIRQSAIKELEQRFSEKVQDLENQLREKDEILNSRRKDLEEFRSQLSILAKQKSGLGPANDLAKDFLKTELKKESEALAAKDARIRELEQTTSQMVNSLKVQLDERERLLRRRDGELESLRSEITALTARLREPGAPKERMDYALHAQRSKVTRVSPLNDPKLTDETESSRSFQDMGAMLAEKEELLKTRDQRIEKLEAELKEKRTELARHEIDVRQSLERRDIWKRRLANFGINLKD